jgi:CheY-like chemotaxis protein
MGSAAGRWEGGPFPIIAVTAEALVENRERCLGARHGGRHLPKPFQKRDLERVPGYLLPDDGHHEDTQPASAGPAAQASA